MVNITECGDILSTEDEGSLPPFSIDDTPKKIPAAGWRNGSSLNNVGENGNYWSSTPNESDTQNAYNLNFNSGNFNRNWNNRNNGHTVRPVSALASCQSDGDSPSRFSLSKEQLLSDLYKAYKDARRNKRGKTYQLQFECQLEDNLVELRDELYSGTYTPRPSTCFIIHDPKMREVFAADFRDRVVHHLFYNYTHVLFERTFIHDTYSCIKGRGTHYGIKRLQHHIRCVSAGYTRQCFILKLDIKGYFMNIDRKRLMQITLQSLDKMRKHTSDMKGLVWEEKIDYDFVTYLLHTIVMADPLKDRIILGSLSDWDGLPPEKSIIYSAEDCGLPIGNLSSQLFSNIYLNELDQYVKRILGCRHYGRYVDDAFIVENERSVLYKMIPLIDEHLRSILGLSLNKHKVRVCNAYYGVEFLGAYIKPFRTYISSSSLKRIRCRFKNMSVHDTQNIQSVVNSCLGVMSHYRSFCIRRVLCGTSYNIMRHGIFSSDWLRYHPYLFIK